MNLAPVSHRDLALAPASALKRPYHAYTEGQKRELNIIRKTMTRHERSVKLKELSTQWNLPLISVSQAMTRTGALVTDREIMNRRRAKGVPTQKRVKPAKNVKVKGPRIETKLPTRTQLRFKISSLKIENGEIVMGLTT